MFYWLSWFLIIYLFFFYRAKQSVKQLLIVCLLLNIILLRYEVTIIQFTISFPFILGSLLLFLLIGSRSFSIKSGFTLWCLVLSYVGLHYIFIASPIWLIVNSQLLIGGSLIIMVVFTNREFWDQVLCFLIASWLGEALLAYNLQILNWQHPLGSNFFYSYIYLGIAILYLINYATKKGGQKLVRMNL